MVRNGFWQREQYKEKPVQKTVSRLVCMEHDVCIHYRVVRRWILEGRLGHTV